MITVRPATPSDTEQLRTVDALATQTLRQTYRPNRAALERKAKISPSLSRLVATIDNHVVGTVQYYEEGDRLRIIGLAVHSDFRRQGIAREIMIALEAIAEGKGSRRLHLYTVKETGNVPVFERLGFHVVAERDDELSESHRYAKLTDVEMEKALEA